MKWILDTLINEDHVIRKRFSQYVAVFSVSIAYFSLGTVMGWTGNNSADLQNGNLNGIPIDDDELGWIGSLINLGALVSCLIAGPLANLIGRKWALLSLVLPNTMGWLLIILAQNVEMIYVGRLVCGLASGAILTYGALYTTETVEKEIRGALGVLGSLLLTLGIFIAYILGYATNARISAIISACFPLIFAIVFSQQPESPYYNLKKRNETEALKNLKRLRGKNHDLKRELEEMKAAIKEEEENKVPILQSLKRRETKKAIFLALGLMFFEQTCGFNAVLFYTSRIFQSAGIDDSILSAELSTIIVGFIQFLGCITALFVAETLNRRVMLAISGIFMAIPAFLLGTFFTLQERNLAGDDVLSQLSFVPVMSLCVFIFSLAVGYGPLCLIMSVEVSPPESRSFIASLSGMFNWFMVFIITRFYLNMRNALGGDVTFYIFGTLSLLAAIYPFVFLPETRGKSLEEIQNAMNGGKSEKTYSK